MNIERKVYGILISVIVFAVFAAWISYPKAYIVNESFEDGFGRWTPDADVPEDPNNPGHFVEWYIKRVSNMSNSGQYSLEFFIDGRQDDGTIWIEQKISVKRNTVVHVKLSFYLYSEAESFNAIAEVCAYANVLDAEKETDFADGQLGQANQVAGWKRYEYSAAVNSGSNDEIWVALGITVLWETQMTYYIDDIEITIQ
ncbi:MAG: hypothetical protein QXX08_04890 [Candidatus Bathyarchaeia archaeon]